MRDFVYISIGCIALLVFWAFSEGLRQVIGEIQWTT